MRSVTVNRYGTLIGATALGAVTWLLGAQPAQAQSFGTVEFKVGCTALTASGCIGATPGTSYGVGRPTAGNRNNNQTFAVDMESPTQPVPIPDRNRNYATRYFLTTPSGGNINETGTRSQTTSGSQGLFNGVNYTTNVVRIDYFNSPASSVVPGTGSNFTRPFTYSLENFTLAGSCALCNQLITSVGPLTGTGSWTGNGNYNTGTGTYRLLTDPGTVQFASGTRGTIVYEAFVTIANGVVTSTGGSIKIVVVPAPLPLLGGGVAFAWSRRLRRRVSAARA